MTADVATILGVSIAGFIGTPLVAQLLGRQFSLSDFLNGVLFYFIFIISFLIFSVFLLRNLWNHVVGRNYITVELQSLLFIIFLTFLAYAFTPLKDIWVNLFGNEERDQP